MTIPYDWFASVEEAKQSANYTLPLLEWCDIPEGYATIGKQKILVPAFRMAKYPVTYAQYEAFIAAPDGYQNNQWWRRLARYRKTSGDQAWKIDKHPREHVNWHESMAFSRWLASKTGLPITLPTESQWQRAAQGDDGREYPWGDDFDKSKCNTSEGGPKKTTPVDQYPNGASPFGVMDMAGNVWEWCLSKWAATYQHPEDNNPTGGTDVCRVLRGGSWFGHMRDARAASRYANYAGLRISYFGCRLVVG